MSTQVDTVTKLSYLLPTGTFLTFQVLAPLTTNNGHCGLTERVLTAITLFILVCSCIVTSLTDSYIALDGKLHTGLLTPRGLWVPGQGTKKLQQQTDENGSKKELPQQADENGPKKELPQQADENGSKKLPQQADENGPKKELPQQADENGSKKLPQQADEKGCLHWHSGMVKLLAPDIITAALSAVAFLTLTMFTDPVSSCFYPHLSETVLKTLPVLLTTVLSFLSTFLTKIRHGYGNSVPHAPEKESSKSTDDGATKPSVNAV